MCGAIIPSDVRQPGQDRQREDSDEEDDWSDDAAPRRSAGTMTNGPRTKNVRGPQKTDDSDSDFDI
jgi:hypothetical protein